MLWSPVQQSGELAIELWISSCEEVVNDDGHMPGSGERPAWQALRQPTGKPELSYGPWRAEGPTQTNPIRLQWRRMEGTRLTVGPEVNRAVSDGATDVVGHRHATRRCINMGEKEISHCVTHGKL